MGLSNTFILLTVSPFYLISHNIPSVSPTSILLPLLLVHVFIICMTLGQLVLIYNYLIMECCQKSLHCIIGLFLTHITYYFNIFLLLPLYILFLVLFLLLLRQYRNAAQLAYIWYTSIIQYTICYTLDTYSTIFQFLFSFLDSTLILLLYLINILLYYTTSI